MRGAYLALDRPELGFTIKELSRGMAKPSVEDARALRRLGRFLAHEPRLVQKFPWQSHPRELRIEVDSDFAGCCRSRKSTSGFVALIGRHCVSTKCKHQSVIALSSGEAEFYALASGLARGIGLQQLVRDWDWSLDLVLGSDSTTAITMATRHGHGRAKHMSVQYLWVQEILAREQARVVKVGTDVNRADLMTKHLPRTRMEGLLHALGYHFPGARRPLPEPTDRPARP